MDENNDNLYNTNLDNALFNKDGFESKYSKQRKIYILLLIFLNIILIAIVTFIY